MANNRIVFGEHVSAWILARETATGKMGPGNKSILVKKKAAVRGNAQQPNQIQTNYSKIGVFHV